MLADIWLLPNCRQLPALVCCFWDNARQQAKIRILTFPLHLCHRDHTPREGVELCTQEVTHCWIVNLCLWPSLGEKGRNHLILIFTFHSTFTVQGSNQAPEVDKPKCCCWEMPIQVPGEPYLRWFWFWGPCGCRWEGWHCLEGTPQWTWQPENSPHSPWMELPLQFHRLLLELGENISASQSLFHIITPRSNYMQQIGALQHNVLWCRSKPWNKLEVLTGNKRSWVDSLGETQTAKVQLNAYFYLQYLNVLLSPRKEQQRLPESLKMSVLQQKI